MTTDRYRINVSIFRGTSAGRALTMMANGIRCVADDMASAEKVVDEYKDAAAAVLSGVSKGLTFGVVNVIDCHAGLVVLSECLVGTAGK